MKRLMMLYCVLAASVLAACAPDQSGAQIDPPRLAATATPTDAPTSEALTLTPTIRTPSPTITRRPPTATPTAPPLNIGPPPIDLPAPLLVMSSNTNELSGLWFLDGVNDPVRFARMSQPGYFRVSPDGKRALYADEQGIWLLDPASGERRLIIPRNDPVDYLFLFRWWPGREGFVTGTGDIAMCSGGYLTYVGLDGQIEILDDEVNLSTDFAVSPDGQTIAYWGYRGDVTCMDQPSRLYLYHVDGEREEIDLGSYGLSEHSIEGISWSPDGTQLGLVTTTYEQGAPNLDEHIVILHLARHTSRILREFRKFTTGTDYGSAPVWLPSGDWLVFQTAEYTDDGSNGFGLWYADVNSVRRLTPADSDNTVYGPPAISPDQEWIAAPSMQGITFVRISDGAIFLWEMPVAPYQVDWITLP